MAGYGQGLAGWISCIKAKQAKANKGVKPRMHTLEAHPLVPWPTQATGQRLERATHREQLLIFYTMLERQALALNEEGGCGLERSPLLVPAVCR